MRSLKGATLIWGESAEGRGAVPSLEQLFQHRIGEAACQRDGVEGLGQPGEALDLDKKAAVEFVCNDDGRHDGEADFLARQQSDHGHVVHFRNDAGANVELVERLQVGGINSQAKFEINRVAPAIALLIGDNGLAPAVGMRALKPQ
jgi:hypothetical protein